MKWLVFVGCLFLFGCDGGGNLTPTVPNSKTEQDLVGSIAVFNEVEVNDDISMANPVTIPNASPSDDFVGFQVNGNITTSVDGVDTFAFTVNRRRMYAIELCTFPCEFPTPGASMSFTRGYFEILDQSGERLLISNTHNGGVGNYREIIFEAGVLYYASIIAQETNGNPQAYTLVAVEISF